MLLKKKKSESDNFTPFINENKPNTYPQSRNLICEWTDKMKCSFQYKMLKAHVKHGMVADEIHETISFRQSKWLEKYMNFFRKKIGQKNMFSKKTSINYAITPFTEKQLKKYLIEQK